MATRYFRKKSILAKIESPYGQDASPTGAANAINARNVSFTPADLEYEERNVVRAYLGQQEQLVVTAKSRLAYECEIAGSGTAGVAPAWGPLVRACGFSETILAAAHSGTAQAGAASTITLAAGASASDDAYRGMRIKTTGGTGSGQARVISTYNGTTKVATVSEAWTTPPDVTTTYSIDAQVAYQRISSAFESVTEYFNMDGKRHILLGSRGTMGLRLNARRVPFFAFDFLSLYAAPSDTALPTDVFTAWKKPLPVNNANSSGFTLHSYAGKLYGLELDVGSGLVYRNIVGTEDVQITDYGATGKVTIEDPTQAQKDYFAAVTGVTLGALNLLHGTTAGNQVHIHAPAAQLTNPAFEDRDSVIALALAQRLVPNLGNDELSIQAL